MSDFQLAQAFPPGEFLKDELEERGWTQSDLAEIMGRHVSVVNEILLGKRGLTPDTARALADALGGSAQFWLNLESIYRLWLLPKDDTVSRRAKLYATAPVREMIRRGWITASPSLDVLEQEVFDFMGDEESTFAHAARKSTSYDEPVTSAQRAWLCRARQLAPAVQVTQPFSRDKMPELVGQLRGLAEAPENVAHVPRILAGYGIRFLMIEALAGTKIDGASFWMDSIPVIVLSLRFDRIDHFWHTLMHEVAHIWFADGTVLDQDIVNGRPVDNDEIEQRADGFAAASLIPREHLHDFVVRIRPLFSAVRIQNFARTMQVHAGIVVGQLQHMHEIGYQNLRRMLVPVRDIITRTALTDGWGSQLPNSFT